MDTGTDKNNLYWLSPDVLIEFIDELREAGYKIGISQYIAAQDLILMLIAQGQTLDSPEHLRNLLGPIFCSSATEQEEFQQHFDRWVQLYSQINLSKVEVDVEAEALSAELETERALSYQIQGLIFFISILIFLSILLFASQTENKSVIKPHPNPTVVKSPTSIFPPPIPPETLPTVPPKQLNPKPIIEPSKKSSLNWQILLQIILQIILILLTVCVAYLLWRLWWIWRANLFLQRHSTTQQPELQKISLTGFEENLIPSIVLLQIAQSLRYRIRIPSNELDVDKTIDATLKRWGWLTPIYRTYQVLPEYLFLVNRTSYRDHQSRFVQEIIERLKNEGVFVSIYFFDDDPRICFPDDQSPPLKLREIRAKYSQHCLVIISDTDNFFSSISGELEPWVNQLTNWENRAVLTPTPAENWGYKELEVAEQFIILPATIKGLLVLSQRLRQGFATYFLVEEPRIPLPDYLRIQPYLWIERNPPSTEQINAMLDSLEKYLGKDSFYWLSACAVFPELDWNITIYLGNVLKTESGVSLIEVCSLTDLARLPWLRYGYMPDWLRVYLITTLSQEQQQIIRTGLQNLLITAVQGSVSKLQLEIGRQYRSLLPKLANPILDILSKKAAVDSPLRDYIFLGFMREQSLLSIRVSDEFSRVLQRQKRNYWWMKALQKLGVVIKPPIHQPSFAQSPNFTSLLISRRKFLKWLGLGGVGLLTAVVAQNVTKNSSQNLLTIPNSTSTPTPTPTPLKSFEFEIVRVNLKGSITDRAKRDGKSFTEDVGNGVTLEMVAIAGGSFMMGSPAGEKGRSSSESPQHEVTVPPFFMGKYPITQAQWRVVAALKQVNRKLEVDPSNFKGDNLPIEQISWYEAVEFCDRLSEVTNRHYRLPSEAEWEYACRAGTTTPFHFGETITSDLANYYGEATYADEPKGKFLGKTTPVGNFKVANAFGLYDMHGNVWEWCYDHWHPDYKSAPTDGSTWIDKNIKINKNDNQSRLLRGGSWDSAPGNCRSAGRGWDGPGGRNSNIGFRVVVSAART